MEAISRAKEAVEEANSSSPSEGRSNWLADGDVRIEDSNEVAVHGGGDGLRTQLAPTVRAVHLTPTANIYSMTTR